MMAINSGVVVRLEWIDTEDAAQVKWAMAYLKKKEIWETRFEHSDPLSTRRLLVARLTKADTNGDAAKLDRQMRAAWAQQKRRRQSPDLIPYSFFMRREVAPALHRLAHRTCKPISRALEELILEDKSLASTYRKMYEEDTRSYRENFDKRGGPRMSKFLAEQDRKELNRLKKTTDLQWALIEQLLQQVAVYKISTPFPKPLTEEQKLKAFSQSQDMLGFYKNEIETNATTPEAYLEAGHTNRRPPQNDQG